jgi:hypothetical protein
VSVSVPAAVVSAAAVAMVASCGADVAVLLGAAVSSVAAEAALAPMPNADEAVTIAIAAPIAALRRKVYLQDWFTGSPSDAWVGRRISVLSSGNVAR